MSDRDGFQVLQWRGFGLRARYNAIYSAVIFWALLAALGRLGLGLDMKAAILWASGATLLHTLSLLGHHFGHWVAGKRAGYAMNGLAITYLLGISLYPQEEPPLPAETHIQRAQGGPLLSLLLSLLSGAFVWAGWPPDGLADYLATFMLLDNLLVFTLGALLPLGFTDGSSLLYWLPRRGE